MNKKRKVVQLGGIKSKYEDFEDTIRKNNLDYEWIKFNKIRESQILDSNKHLTKQYSNSIFILDKTSEFINDNVLLKSLPANATIIEIGSEMEASAQHISKIKNFQFMHLDGNFMEILQDNFLVKPEGSRLPTEFTSYSNSFMGTIQQFGHDHVEFTGRFSDSDKYEQLMSWDRVYYYTGNPSVDVYAENSVLAGDVDLLYKIFLLDPLNNNIVKTIKISGEKIHNNVIISAGVEAVNIYVSVYARGKWGKVSIGTMHIDPSRHGRGKLAIGGDSISDSSKNYEKIAYYFDAGDLNPPLNIYFGGFEGITLFEGYRMMKSRKAPFIIFSDNRLRGGSFYVGNEELEKKLVKVIADHLQLLGFNKNQLVMSGISMGTFAALYYSVDLKPSAVLVAKPLVDLGTMAANERVNRPGGFVDSLDVLLLQTGQNNAEGISRLNDKFWRKFSQGNFEDTTFLIGYMKQDDYDKDAFFKLNSFLKKKYPEMKIIHKGFVGRHNDDPSISAWFQRQQIRLLDTLRKSYI